MKRLWVAVATTMVAAGAAAQMPGSMMTANYFPVVDGTRYDYMFASGAHATATAVMHSGQRWAGATGLTSVHMTFTCRDAQPCALDATDFYRMDPDGLHYFGGEGESAGDAHDQMMLAMPEWLLKNPVTPGTMMGPGMGYAGGESWQMGVAGTDTMMGSQSYTSRYSALALETVSTPAGAFTNALHVQEHRGSGYTRDVWYAAGVGMVRWMDSSGEEALLAKMTPPAGPVPAVGRAVEYYHAGLDHYFMTAAPAEIDALDGGRFPGWRRTGMSFNVVAATDPTPDAMAVCRFYGNPAMGLDTHFYTASADECAAVQRNWPMQWTLESTDVFRIFMPDPATGACPAGTQPVYRSWNGRADTNHRFTLDPSVQMGMMGRGAIAEGYGDPPVGMCSPQ
jgi:hypothetical protein